MCELARFNKLEDVLDDYVASDVDPVSRLDKWIKRYPEFERELTEFAVSWSLMVSLPPAADAEEVDEETLILRGMSVVQNLLHNQSTELDSYSLTTLESLIAEGRKRGLEPCQLAQAVGMGESLLRKLDRRLIRYATVPEDAIYELSNVIQKKIKSVTDYLQLNPTLAAATEHRSEQAPMLIEQENFFDAVRNDPTIRHEHAVRWLELEQSMGGL